MLLKLCFICKEALLRLAIAILRDRVATDLAKVGYTRNDAGMWNIVREDVPVELTVGGLKIEASMHEANAIRQLLDNALVTMYSNKKITPDLPMQHELRSPSAY